MQLFYGSIFLDRFYKKIRCNGICRDKGTFRLVTITLDGNKPQTFSRTWFAAVMNQKYEGGGFKFCPNASPEDGLLDVIVIEGISKLKMLFCLPSALWGKHTRIRGVHILQCRNVHITSAHSLPVHKDGESGGIQREFSVTIEKKPLKIIMPVL